jgi:hypothetical protein
MEPERKGMLDGFDQPEGQHEQGPDQFKNQFQREPH